MREPALNLARRPFANRRPVRRLAAVLWLAAAMLLAVNARNYWGHFSGSEDQQEELGALRAGIAEETAARDEALARLEQYDVDWQRAQIDFLNGRIAERTFAWSALFDHLAEVLPPTVRLSRVSPRVTSGRTEIAGQRAARKTDDAVFLSLTGMSEDDAVLLELVDAFYAHPRFRRPDLQIESRSDSGAQVEFSMSVQYTPEAVRAPERQRDAQPPPAETEAAPPKVES